MSQNTERLQDFLQAQASQNASLRKQGIAVQVKPEQTVYELMVESYGPKYTNEFWVKIAAKEHAEKIMKTRESDPLFDFAMMVEELNHPTK